MGLKALEVPAGIKQGDELWVILILLYFESFPVVDNNSFDLPVNICFKCKCSQSIFAFALHYFNTTSNFLLIHTFNKSMLSPNRLFHGVAEMALCSEKQPRRCYFQ